MEFEISQVGNRWFIVCDKETQIKVHVEASYGYQTLYEKPDYQARTLRKWVLTGKGSKRYRDELITALNTHIDPVAE